MARRARTIDIKLLMILVKVLLAGAVTVIFLRSLVHDRPEERKPLEQAPKEQER